MANPELIEGFDTNEINIEDITESLKLYGYSDLDIVESFHFNKVLNQLFKAANKNKIDGVWDWENPATTGINYNLSSIVRYSNNFYVSKISNNSTTPSDGANWRLLDFANYAKVTGNIATATKLQTARLINGVNFDGTSNITVYDSTKLSDAGHDFSENGYMKLSNGLIIQWGTTAQSGNNAMTGVSVMFNVAFNSCFGVSCNVINPTTTSSAGPNLTALCKSFSTSSFIAVTDNTDTASGTVAIFWIAIGY